MVASLFIFSFALIVFEGKNFFVNDLLGHTCPASGNGRI